MVIPRPLRDILTGPFQCNQAEVRKTIGGTVVCEPAENMIKGSIRLAATALSAFALFKTNSSLQVAAALAVCISVPCVLIAGGSWLLYDGAISIASALKSGDFAALGVGVVKVVAGYFILEKHDYIPNKYNPDINSPGCNPKGYRSFGLGEKYVITPISDSLIKTFVSWSGQK